MSLEFDPYYTWLGIPPEEQPPDHYRLLGVRRFENNHEVIANASRRQETHLQTFETGPHARQATQMLVEIGKARKCLLSLEAKGAYDRELRNKDAPSLSTASGNRPPTRPDAPRRPSNPIGPQSAELIPPEQDLPRQGDLIHSARSGDLLVVNYSSHVPTVHSPVARRRVESMGGRLAVFGVVGALIFLSMLVVVLGVAWGAWTFLAHLPSGSPSQQQPSTIKRLVIVSKDTSSPGAFERTAGTGELKLLVGDAQDLLAGFDPQKHTKPQGCMVKDGDGWIPSGRNAYEAMFFPVNMPEEYVLESTLTLRAHSLGIVQGLVAGNTQCHVTVDGFDGERDGQGMRTTLEAIDGHTPHDLKNYPCMTFGTLLTRDKPAELRYVVLKDRILVECDGAIVLDWTGGLRRVSPDGTFVVGDRQNLFWGTWQTRCRLSKLVVRPILDVK